MTKLGIQISSVRKYLQTPEDVLESFRKVSKMGYDTIQIQWISPDVSMEFINDTLKETGMNCIGTQDTYDEVVPKLDEVIKMNDLWGGKYICVSGIPERYHSYEGCMEFIAELNDITKRLKDQGKILTFHPRIQDIMVFNGKNTLDLILENTSKDFQFTIDMYHLLKAGFDGPEWIRKVKGRMDLIHFKDYLINEKGEIVLMPVGQGVTNWKEIFDACIETGVEYAFAEQETAHKDHFECLEESYKYITANGIK